MSDRVYEEPSYRELPSDVAQEIGRMASDWAALEFQISQVIWALAKTPPALGACLTTQIYSLDAKIKALVSLMRIRRVDEKVIKETNQFAEDVRAALEVRNRSVHDPWYVLTDGSRGRLEITSNKKLVFERRAVRASDLEADRAKILKSAKRFALIAAKVRDALPSLPDTPHAELHPIILAPRNRI